MVSAINPNNPIYGAPTTVSVRNNFTSAKSEIEALQSNSILTGGPYLQLTGGTINGNLTVTGPVTSNSYIRATMVQETRVAMGASNNINCTAGAFFTKTISVNTTFTVSNVPAVNVVPSFILELTNGGAFSITWWAGVTWQFATPPVLSAAGVDALGFYTLDGGTTWRGMLLAKAMA